MQNRDAKCLIHEFRIPTAIRSGDKALSADDVRRFADIFECQIHCLPTVKFVVDSNRLRGRRRLNIGNVLMVTICFTVLVYETVPSCFLTTSGYLNFCPRFQGTKKLAVSRRETADIHSCVDVKSLVQFVKCIWRLRRRRSGSRCRCGFVSGRRQHLLRRRQRRLLRRLRCHLFSRSRLLRRFRRRDLRGFRRRAGCHGRNRRRRRHNSRCQRL